MHIYIVEKTLSDLNVNKRHVKVLILGDDLIALWPSQCSDLYNKLLEEFGMKISKDKHLVSSLYGNFARLFVSVRKDGINYVGFTVKDTLPVGMFNRSRLTKLDYIAALSQQSKACSENPKVAIKFRDALYIGYPHVLDVCNDFKIQAHCPLIGLGLPRKSGIPFTIHHDSHHNYLAYKVALSKGYSILQLLIDD